MINSIVNRRGRLVPYTETEISIIRSAIKLFLKNGYTKTTFKMIEEDSGVKVGNITYYFHSKEKRDETIAKILAMDYEKIACDMFKRFVKRRDNDLENE